MHGLVVKWNRELNNLDVISSARIYEKSVAAHVLTLMVDVPSAHLIRAVFSSYDAESETYKALTEPLNMMESGVGQYELPIPDIVLAESGDRLITFMDYEPIAQGTETVYQVLTSGTVRFTVGANGAVLGQTLVPETVADQLQKEINGLHNRVNQIENVTISKTMIDFKIEDKQVIKYYSDGTSATFELGELPEVEKSNNLTELVVPTSAWLYDPLVMRLFVAFSPETTGFNNNKFVAEIERKTREKYAVGAETTAEFRPGYLTLADSIFKGDDGSVLITANTEFEARVLLFSVGGENNKEENGGGKLYLHIIKTEYVFSEPKSVYEGSRVPLKLHYLSTSNTPYTMGTYLSAIPNFFKQQIGKVYYARDDMELRDWQVMFNEIVTENESTVIALNSRGEIQFGDNLLDSPVLSDTVVAIE